MQQEEKDLYEKRKGKSEHSYATAVITSLLTTITALLLTSGMVCLIQRNSCYRQKAAAALHEQKEWYRITLASIGDSVIATDVHSNVIFLNAEAEKMTGWKAQDALNRPLKAIFNIVNEGTRLPVQNPVYKVIQQGKVVGLANHTVLISKDGREHPIADSAAPIKSEEGALLGVILVFQDVTDHRSLEKELIKKAEMLTEKDRRKDEFLAMLAHELRNPLAPVSNALDIIESASVDKKTQAEAVKMANRQVSHMVRLLDDLLDVSRIVSGKISMQFARTNFREVLQAAIETSRLLLNERRHTFDVHVPDVPVWVRGDAIRLSQVISNLLNNAAKYTPMAGHITLEALAEEGELVIRVRDNGIGIAKEILPYIFDVFVQANSAMERSQNGLGIGLTLVKSIAELHEGSVEVRSEGLGKGTEFTMRLPIIDISPQDNGSEAGQPGDAPQPGVHGSSRAYKILVVDDNEASAKTLGWMVEILGHEAKVVCDGPTAIRTAHDYRPDVVLLDIGLPDMNGYEVCKAMRNDPALQDTVFYAQTGWGQKEYIERSKQAGFDHHFTKPVSMEALQQELEKLE